MNSISQCSSCQKDLPSDANSLVSDQAIKPASTQNFCTSCCFLIHSKESPIDNRELSIAGPNVNLMDSEKENQQIKVQNMRIGEHNELILDKREKIDKLQGFFEHHLTRADFERQVLFAEEEKFFQDIFEKNEAPCENISKALDQLTQTQITPEYLDAYDQEEKLTFAFQHHDAFNILVKDNHSFREGQNFLVENLKKFEGPSLNILKSIEIKFLAPEAISQVSKLYKSQAEAMFTLITKTGLFKFEASDEGWLVIYPSRGEDSNEKISFEKIKNFEKVDAKLSREEDVYLMILGIKFLLENCLEKASNIYLNFCKRYITDKETKSFNDCALWTNNKIKNLTLDFTECTFENEETPLIILRDKTIQLENLEELRLVLNDSSATCKTTRNFHKEIIPRLKSLKSFEFSFHSLPFNSQEIYEIIQGSLQKMSNLEVLSLELEKMQIKDEEIGLLFHIELPNLKNLKDLKLWLNETQITDQGFLNIFKSIQSHNYAQNLEILALGLDESDISDESLVELANNVLPLMKNLKKFWLWVDDTSVTDKSLIPLCQNIKHFAANLKVFVLSVTGTSATDEMVNVFTLEALPLMKNLEHFHFWLPGPDITDQILGKFFEALSADILVNVKKLWLYFGETEMTDQSLTIFSEKVVPTLKKLYEFNFSCDGTKISDFSLQPLFENLSIAGTNLSNLIISLNETDIGDQSILALAGTLGSLKNLRTLSLGLNQTNLEDSGLGCLFASFESLARNLQRLILSFEGTKITGQSILPLRNGFKSLKEFKLLVSETEIGDIGLKVLFENLKETPKTLERIWLSLTQTLITDESLLGLAKVISLGAKSIQEFDLWAFNIKVSDSGVSSLVGSLENSARNIRKLALSLAGSEITDVICQMLNEKVVCNLCNLQEFQVFFGRTQVTDASMLPFLETLAGKVQHVRTFEFQFNDMNTENSVGIFAKKVLLNLVQAQGLKLFWNAELSDLTYRDLCVNTQKTIRNINNFQISGSHFSITTDFRKPSLQEIQFELSNDPEITDRTMKEIIENFKDKVSQVKFFSFQVNRTQISHGSLQALGAVFFSKMPNLESLILELEEIPFPAEAFCFMCQNLQHAAMNLKLFRIQIDTPEEINGPCVINLAEYGLANMRNLENLTIRFSAKVEGEDKAMKILLENLQYSAKTIRYFELFLKDVKLSLEGVQALVVPKFEVLENFSLGLSSTNPKDEDFTMLFSSLEGSLENLRSFSFMVDEKSVTDKTMDAFSSVVLPQLTNLDTLKIFFGGIKFGNESLKKLNGKLQETCDKIQNLLFNFGQNCITSEAVNEFALNTLPAMKSLETLEIGFGDNAEVDNEAIVNLFDGLREIIGDLTSLELDLSKTGLTDMGIEGFKEKLAEELEHLERFVMDISGCNVSEENQNFINELVKY